MFKTHQSVNLKYVPFNVCQFCHNKAVEHKRKKSTPQGNNQTNFGVGVYNGSLIPSANWCH